MSHNNIPSIEPACAEKNRQASPHRATGQSSRCDGSRILKVRALSLRWLWGFPFSRVFFVILRMFSTLGPCCSFINLSSKYVFDAFQAVLYHISTSLQLQSLLFPPENSRCISAQVVGAICILAILGAGAFYQPPMSFRHRHWEDFAEIIRFRWSEDLWVWPSMASLPISVCWSTQAVAAVVLLVKPQVDSSAYRFVRQKASDRTSCQMSREVFLGIV